MKALLQISVRMAHVPSLVPVHPCGWSGTELTYLLHLPCLQDIGGMIGRACCPDRILSESNEGHSACA